MLLESLCREQLLIFIFLVNKQFKAFRHEFTNFFLKLVGNNQADAKFSFFCKEQ